jgi:hypothetical protein
LTYPCGLGWKRFLLAEAPRQVINGIALYSAYIVNGSFQPQRFYSTGSDLMAKISFALMSFTFCIWTLSALSLTFAGILYVPLLFKIRGNLKEYVCHKIDKRLAELLRKRSRRRIIEERRQQLLMERELQQAGITNTSIMSRQPTLPKIEPPPLKRPPLAGSMSMPPTTMMQPKQPYSPSSSTVSPPMSPASSTVGGYPRPGPAMQSPYGPPPPPPRSDVTSPVNDMYHRGPGSTMSPQRSMESIRHQHGRHGSVSSLSSHHSQSRHDMHGGRGYPSTSNAPPVPPLPNAASPPPPPSSGPTSPTFSATHAPPGPYPPMRAQNAPVATSHPPYHQGPSTTTRPPTQTRQPPPQHASARAPYSDHDDASEEEEPIFDRYDDRSRYRNYASRR